ncbi:MAG: N-acetylmuramoyl-L-alanine amidase [Desulfomonile tiedjei]|uniref:N-acetylmuramoyl-L-alanine amidase n=1 Tax=Desulfomonile tiedjei TaxID=2358 RepID=A0A9D6UY32_9BACT|nr:N-acetylmuramoyl-L-alanine amidase [Desulfomonile tiedjei]
MPRIVAKIAEPPALSTTPTFLCAGKPLSTCTRSVFSFLAVIVLIVLVASPCIARWDKPPSFNDACKKLDRLSRDPSSTREQWLEAINAFVLIRATGKPAAAAKLSLFHAGKACLSLYRSSANPEDLEKAIKYLSDFNKNYHKGPYLIPSLRELKEAHTCKRELEARKSSEPIPGPQPITSTVSGTESRKVTAPQYRGNGLYSVQGPALVVPANVPKVEPEQPQSPQRDWNGNASSHGKPSGPDSQSTLKKIPTENRIASLPQSSISDVAPPGKTAKTGVKEFVVVIDPGHGGKDPGAVSRDGSLKEKDLTLDVAKRLKTALERKNRRLRVTLTRSDDRSLALQERTAIANSLNADLFISIHCNAASDGSSKGIETFLLDKASSPRAMRVAARENGIPPSKMSDLEATLVDLMVTSKKTESTELAKTVQSALARGLERSAFSVRNRGVKQAPFYVLLGAKMPAILVECAFISNNREQRKLTSPEYLGNVAEGLANGAALYIRGLGEDG